MADLYSSDLGANSRKAQPSTTFGTRRLQFLVLSITGQNLYTDNGQGSYKDSGSLYSQLVREIQLVAELYYLGAPTEHFSQGNFVFGIASETASWYYNEGANDYAEEDYPEHAPYGLNTLVDRLQQFFQGNNQNTWDLSPLVDTGFGLMPGESLSYLQN